MSFEKECRLERDRSLEQAKQQIRKEMIIALARAEKDKGWHNLLELYRSRK
jgi:hypothetical protein